MPPRTTSPEQRSDRTREAAAVGEAHAVCGGHLLARFAPIMTKSAKLLCALLLAPSFMVLACTSQPAAPAPVAEAQPQAEATTSAETGAALEQGAPKIASDEATFNFGAIKPVDSIEHIFKIKNVGTADLHIERVQKT